MQTLLHASNVTMNFPILQSNGFIRFAHYVGGLW